jgi:PAS domain S-box-containing protein
VEERAEPTLYFKSPMLDREIPLIIRVATAPMLVALAVGAKLALEPALESESPSRYLLMTSAVLATALLAGFWPGFLATVLAALAIDYFFLEPRYSVLGNSGGEYVQLAIFVAEGTLVSAVGAALRSTTRERGRLLERERLARTTAEEGRRRYRELMDGLGVALYTTDAEGRITFVNEAAEALWGRRPEVGKDRWCGSWRLYHTDGRPMPHDECPLAVSLREGRPIHGVEAIAERPNGTRVHFVPFPTPLRSSTGEITGMVNVLIDVTERRRAEQALREAEAKYRGIFENAVFGVFQTTLGGRFMSANDALGHMLGYESAQELIETVTDIANQVHADPTRRAEFVRLLEEQGVVTGFTAQAKRKDGATIWISLSGRALRDESGRLTGFEGIAEDTTARVEAEAQIASLLGTEQAARVEAELAQRRLWFLSEASGELAASLEYGLTLERIPGLAVPELTDICELYTFREDGTVVEEVFACANAELDELVRALHGGYRPVPGAPHPLVRLMRGRRPVLVSDVHGPVLMSLAQNATQQEILEKLELVSYLAVPLVAGGRLIGAMTLAAVDPQKRFGEGEVAIAEILARRVAMALENSRLYNESQLAQEELRAAAESKDEFLGVMSHELRTPITAIMGGARLLRSRSGQLDDEAREEVLADIEGESDRMYRMVENLLALGRLELGQEVSREPVLAQRVVRKLATSFMARKPGREVEVDAEEDLPPAAASPAYLELAIRNLLSNADKYSPAGEPIEIRATQTADELEIAVMDRGPGIDPAEAESIFDRFYRSSRTAYQAPGAGLGLTVCKRMVEAQSGRVWARPREGGGSEFGLTLPVYKNGADT